jgi:hypothetical protein
VGEDHTIPHRPPGPLASAVGGAPAGARPFQGWPGSHIGSKRLSLLPAPVTCARFERAQLAPYELTHVRASPGDCTAGWGKRHVRFESSEALAEQPAVARTAVELHGCCARGSLAEALLCQHIDGVARASSAGTKSGSSARSLVLHTMLAPVVENRTIRGSAIGLDDEPNSEIADGGATGRAEPSAARGTSVGDFPTSSVSAVQLKIPETMGSAPTHPVKIPCRAALYCLDRSYRQLIPHARPWPDRTEESHLLYVPPLCFVIRRARFGALSCFK